MSKPPRFSNLSDLPLVHRGKVRDSYAIDDSLLLMVASDRLSAYDVVLPDQIPGKGALLTELSNFWFQRSAHIIANHLTEIEPSDLFSSRDTRDFLAGRAVVVKRLQPLPVEAIVRGYLIGSGWRDYCDSGTLCEIQLPPGLQQAQKLPQAIFTPSSKAAPGDHDANIGYPQCVSLLGAKRATEIRRVTLEIYRMAGRFAESRGVLIADTKLEFGLDGQGKLVLMDELLTPDSSRFWPRDQYSPGASPVSYDKQFVRDYLDTLDWDKQPPGPSLPKEIIAQTAAKYRQIRDILIDPPATG